MVFEAQSLTEKRNSELLLSLGVSFLLVGFDRTLCRCAGTATSNGRFPIEMYSGSFVGFVSRAAEKGICSG